MNSTARKGSQQPSHKPAGVRPFWKSLLINLSIMACIGLILIWVAMWGLNIWTHHGEDATVPSLRGLTYSEALAVLESQGFECEVTDSVYETTTRPGTVMDQSPKPNAKVKEGRRVYLTINAFSPKSVVIPSLSDMSLRQAQATLESLGLKDINVHYVPSDFKDLVIGANYNGKPLMPGTRIPVNAAVTILVGTGYDSLGGEDDEQDGASEDEVEIQSQFFD